MKGGQAEIAIERVTPCKKKIWKKMFQSRIFRNLSLNTPNGEN
jgi:hypothetical protein